MCCRNKTDSDIRRNSGFSILPEDALTHGQVEVGINPPSDCLLHQWINYLRLQYKLGQLCDLSSFCVSDVCDFFDSQSIRLSPTARQSAGKANVPTIHSRKRPLQSLVS